LSSEIELAIGSVALSVDGGDNEGFVTVCTSGVSVSVVEISSAGVSSVDCSRY